MHFAFNASFDKITAEAVQQYSMSCAAILLHNLTDNTSRSIDMLVRGILHTNSLYFIVKN